VVEDNLVSGTRGPRSITSGSCGSSSHASKVRRAAPVRRTLSGTRWHGGSPPGLHPVGHNRPVGVPRGHHADPRNRPFRRDLVPRARPAPRDRARDLRIRRFRGHPSGPVEAARAHRRDAVDEFRLADVPSDGPRIRPIGRRNSSTAIAAMSASGLYGPTRWPRESSDTQISRSVTRCGTCSRHRSRPETGGSAGSA